METKSDTPGLDRSGLKSRDIWMRGLFMLLFLFAFGLGETILFFIALLQFFWLVATKEPNQLVSSFGASLAEWLGRVVRFLACVSNDKPFPFAPWPTSGNVLSSN